MGFEVFKQTENPRILRVYGPTPCYEIVDERCNPVARTATYSGALAYLANEGKKDVKLCEGSVLR